MTVATWFASWMLAMLVAVAIQVPPFEQLEDDERSERLRAIVDLIATQMAVWSPLVFILFVAWLRLVQPEGLLVILVRIIIVPMAIVVPAIIKVTDTFRCDGGRLTVVVAGLLVGLVVVLTRL